MNNIFRANDSDRNGQTDFWMADVWGLHGLKNAVGDPINLIPKSTAKADYTKAASSGRNDQLEIKPWPDEAPTPSSGYYLAPFRRNESGTPYLDERQDLTSKNRMAFMAFPAKYGKTGKRAFIINQRGKIWAIDAVKGGFNRDRGEPSTKPGQIPVKPFPSDPEKNGYERVKKEK